MVSKVCVLNLNGIALWPHRCCVDVFSELEEIWREGYWDRCFVDVFSEVCALNLNGTALWFDRCYVDVFSDVCVLNFNGIALWRQHWRGVWFVLLRFA